MKPILVTVCALAFVACSALAYTVPNEEATALNAVFDSHMKAAAAEAALVGEILREVARQLEDDDIEAEGDAYFFKALWEKTKSALTNATVKIQVAAKGAYKEAAHHINSAAKDAIKIATEKAQEILAGILSKLGENYALDDSANTVDVVKNACAYIARVGHRLAEQGESLLETAKPLE